ncbi:hypothetical protein N9077_00190 [bacterium]|nr:hypothetical protein [bacterium]
MKSLVHTLLALLFIIPQKVPAELVAHWPLDGNARDLLGNHNGTDSGVTFGVEGAANHTGTAAEFNGSSSTITVPFDSAINPDSFTLSMWVNADSTNGFASPSPVAMMSMAASQLTDLLYTTITAEIGISGPAMATPGGTL